MKGQGDKNTRGQGEAAALELLGTCEALELATGICGEKLRELTEAIDAEVAGLRERQRERLRETMKRVAGLADCVRALRIAAARKNVAGWWKPR
jgi:hypothetical protein